MVGVDPGYFDPIRGMFISASGMNNFELETSSFKRLRRDIEVGAEGLMTANVSDEGSAGTMAFGIFWWQGSSKVGRAVFGDFNSWVP